MSAYRQIPPEFGIGEEGKQLLDGGHPQMLNSILKTFLKHHPEVQQKISRVAPMGDQGTWHAASTLIAFPDIHPVGHQIAVMHKEARDVHNDLHSRKDKSYPSPGSNYWWTPR